MYGYGAVGEDDHVEEREGPGVVKLGGQEEAGGGQELELELCPLYRKCRYIEPPSGGL